MRWEATLVGSDVSKIFERDVNIFDGWHHAVSECVCLCTHLLGSLIDLCCLMTHPSGLWAYYLRCAHSPQNGVNR